MAVQREELVAKYGVGNARILSKLVYFLSVRKQLDRNEMFQRMSNLVVVSLGQIGRKA